MVQPLWKVVLQMQYEEDTAFWCEFVTSSRFLNNQRQRLPSFGCSVLKIESFASSEFRGQRWALCLDRSLRGKVGDNLPQRPTPQLCQLYDVLSVSATCSCGIKRVIIGFRCCWHFIFKKCCWFSHWTLFRMESNSWHLSPGFPLVVSSSSFTNSRTSSLAHSLATFCQHNSHLGLM